MIYGLIGNPVSHSKSPLFFNTFFEDNNLSHYYQTFKLDDISQIENLVYENKELVGLNVTSPFKQQVVGYVDNLSIEAYELNAVNVIKIKRFSNHKFVLYGYNTDCLALYTIFMNMDIDKDKRVVILGTGGAAGAVSWALNRLRIRNLFVSRRKHPDRKDIITYEDLNKELLDDVSMLVNATPVGLDGISCPNIDYSLLSSVNICFDLNYSPDVTPFMAKSSAMGALTMNGYEMFYRQAMKSWEIWNDIN